MQPRHHLLLTCAGALVALGCAGNAPPGAVPRASTSGGVTLSSPRPARNGALRVLVYHDMEGLAGQDDYRTFNYSHPEYYAKGQGYLVADINAVVDGLFAGGATSVEIIDAHGSGNPNPDVDRARLDKRATQLTRNAPFRHYVDVVAPDTYDAIVAVGMHAKTGSKGFASHTVTIGMGLSMNGHAITETEIVAYSWGRVGVPVIFVSGDDRLQRDLATMPWLQYVVTKRATSASTVELRNVAEVHAEMRAKAAAAVRALASAKTMRANEPVRAALKVVRPASLAMLRGVPGVALSADGDEVTFEANDFQGAYDGLNALIGVARLAYPTTTNEVVREHRDSTLIARLQRERLMERWFDVESERWHPPAPTAPTPGRKYYGAQ
ncbi:MAG: M55 family metallopeptidase [Gemmatimonadetes bacterium]|jgi:D-amino peptidase|nr:M55 family metallopeptidase [Gemmatimonadota bacterium]